MFQNLLHLYRKEGRSGKTPLEDFTTEALAGILGLEKNIRDQFIKDFLCLPEGDYFIHTRKKYLLSDDVDCIIDMVLESENTVCFVENKVNSQEGWRQLERYARVLDRYQSEGKETYLFYCTKYPELKKIEQHNFRHIRWHEIARLLTEHNSNPFVNDFINYLKTNKMAQDLTPNTSDFIVFDNLESTLHKCYEFLNIVRPDFESRFCKKLKISDGKNISQININNRLNLSLKGFINGGGASEFHYGIYFKRPCIYVEFYIDRNNENHDTVVDKFEAEKKYYIDTNNVGTQIYLEKNISSLLNDKEAFSIITNWFKNAFETFEGFIKESGLKVWNV